MNAAISSNSNPPVKFNFGPILVQPCICFRPKKTILCNMCGFIIYGRIQRLCEKHPKTIFLNDLHLCPKCQTSNFMEEV